MKIALKDIVMLFEEMEGELNISYVSIVIFVGVDVDSVCTLKMLSKMFKCENIQYKVYPVTTYSDLHSRIQQSRVYDRVKMFMFINCGGLIDLTEFWIVQQQQANIFLFDVHKPIHHKNIQSPDIKIVDDGFSQYEYCPTSEEIQKYDELMEYDLDDDNDQDDYDDEDERVEGSPKRGKKREFREKLKKHKELIETKIAGYYGQNFFGHPSSYSAYRMIRDLNKTNNEYLWYAIVGMTSMYIQQKLTKEVLDHLTETYRSEVSRFNVASSKREKGDISIKKGYQFTLLDHWSLYDSMLNSSYMMTKLHLWEDKGVDKLREFIHTLQISLQDAKQLYKFMPRQIQMKLENNIVPTAEKFRIHDVVFLSFLRQLDYVDSAMASDYHYILTSVLEAPPVYTITFDQMGDHRVRCFWEAYDIFDCNMKQLQPKIDQCKKTMRVLMTQTKNIIERDHLIAMKNLSIANIKNDTDDKKIFEHPSTLIRLAYLLMGVLKQKRRTKSSKPFIANWIDLEKQICMMVGVMMDSRNVIGTRFNEVAERLNISVNHDNFMANIIIIKKENLSAFIKEIGKVIE